MALDFMTDDPAGLLDLFNERIEQKEEKGKIKTWVRSADKEYYTHKSDEWGKAAWFKPIIKDDRLTFNIIKPKNKNVSTVAYGYYHGHLTETFLNHFDTEFTAATSTAFPTSKDMVRKK